MGYSTSFEGELLFTKELKASQLAKLNTILGEDCRDHPEWNAPNLYYIDLELNQDYTGLKWSGAEKTYGMESCVNVVIQEMQKDDPEFGLQGTLSAQGEDVGDRWALSIENGVAVKTKISLKGKKVTCPHCDEQFLLEG